MGTWLRRIWHLFNRSRYERELLREMHQHRESMSDLSRFGDTHRLLEQSRDAWGWNWLDDAWQDLRLGIRGLLRSPVFAVTAILILSFAIGLNLTVFQIANVVLLRGPAVSRPDTLARLHRHGPSPSSNSESLPYPVAQAVAREHTALSAVMVEATEPVIWGSQTTVIEASFVSANWFVELAAHQPLLGRAFAPGIDGAADAPATAIASHWFWKNMLAANPAVIGSIVRINEQPVTLIGVMPETFPELDQQQSAVWLPINQRDYHFPHSNFLSDWSSNNVAMYARLKDGVTTASARDNLRAMMAALHRERPEQIEANEWLEPALATENFTEPAERLGFVGVASTIGLLSTLVFIVAAANLGNLVLSKVTSRARELGVRAALGARRGRIVRQLAVETLPLGVSGAAGGLLVAMWTTQTVATLGELPRYLDFSPDLTAVGISFLFAVFALAVVGALPAWKVAKQDLTHAIKDGGQQVSIRLDRARVRAVMLSAQVGGSCLILIVSAMMLRTLQNVLAADLGFAYEQSAVLEAGLSQVGIKSDAARSYWRTVKERVVQNPETRDAALVLTPPFAGRGMVSSYPETPRLRIANNHVEPEFFSLMGIPLLSGRTFASDDAPATSVIISRTLAQRMYGKTDVVGMGFPKSEPRDTIIGVAGDASATRPGGTDVAELYRLLASDDYPRAVLLARARTDVRSLLPVLREAAAVDTRVFVAVRLLRDDFKRRISGTRIATGIGASIGMLTLLLACIGVFGVVAHSVALRTKEVGIHLALGASRRALLRVSTGHIVRPVVAGIVIGTASAVPIGFALAQSPLQLAYADPFSYGTALSVLALATAAAAFLPARRALRTDPIRSLRHD